MKYSVSVTRWLGGIRPRSATAWVLAALLALTAFLIRLALVPVLGTKAPYLTFFLAALASAALSGFWPGISTAILGAVLAGFVVPLKGWGHLYDPDDPTVLVRFLIASGFASWVCDILIAARERARTAEHQLRESISKLRAAEEDLKRQAEELTRSNRDLEQFAFVASHDMQEPLRAVNIYTQMLIQKTNAANSPELTQFAGFIHDGVARLQRLIGDLLQYSRVIHGDGELATLDTYAAASEAILAYRDLVEKSGAVIQIDPLPAVIAGEAHVIQIFQNLISNAIKYRREGVVPLIRISANRENGLAKFSVSDNGIGIEPEYAEKVFRLFARLHGNRYEGSGLGLAICQRIVERYGGQINVESRVGEGSTFFFTLPLADKEIARQAMVGTG